MYLTRFAVNPARRQARFLLGSPQAMHAAVMASFGPESVGEPGEGRVLWRIDRDGYATWLYVVSPRQPQMTHLAEQAGWSDDSTWSTRDYRPLLDRLEPGQHWAFRLHANPVHVITRAHDGKKIRVGHVTAAQQQQWLLDRCKDHGFSVLPSVDDEPGVTVSQRQKRTFRRGNGSVTLSTAQFDGQLQVEDPDTLRHSLVHGIGKAKGYGCGLLTIASPVSR
ncbi:type I-E CRISPR-associated protein Cas6/Cse3/CasE [Rhodococcus sp. ABRD24]|uniref:type I-E CRISPR-associated protein Cas6/Cse3/CasE n=1 Tax=Rhodococcus sp. ABRD24 TaxID=2507582 RepID=UPI00103FCFD8|nr:type I-E CRISPR-associated protein Cas6/Cse3/CasE [Rhodococcus sp. ABRD24]QBJ97287.1 type I-E CRISPR-associated protein Cas6/Cse3/CasE [Rhodococcus sp. ABRD24]